MVTESMTPFAGPGSIEPISSVTIASIEDIGYEVDYTAAEPYDGTDTTCCNPSSRLLRSEHSSRKSLSNAGRAAAVAYGRQILSTNQIALSSDDDSNQIVALSSDDDSVMFLGDKVTVVLFEENGVVYDVVVTPG